nr:YhjD/YihY/BrkB family envelope integrity protein [Lentibacillus sp. JNUCC-1]
MFKRAMDADLFGMAAQLAYFFLLSLFPFLLFTLTAVGYLPSNQTTSWALLKLMHLQALMN